MPIIEPPPGEYFSRVYLRRGQLTDDDHRFRVRLSQKFFELCGTRKEDPARIAGVMARELGIRVPFGVRGYEFESFFTTTPLPDVFDVVTLIGNEWSPSPLARSMGVVRPGRSIPLVEDDGNRWRLFVERALREHEMAYRLTAEGGVRRFIDDEYDRGFVSAVAAVSAPGLDAVRADFERAHRFLLGVHSQTRDAVRCAFEAVEGLAKRLLGGNRLPRLTEKAVEQQVKPFVLDRCGTTDEIARRATSLLLTGLADFCTAANQYRHAQDVPEPVDPPIEFAVLFVSQAAGYIRFLAGFFDATRNAVQPP